MTPAQSKPKPDAAPAAFAAAHGSADRDEYFEYLAYVQLSGQPEPEESYRDWSGMRVLSFKDWLAARMDSPNERAQR
jgi:hypothetical protein